MRPQRALTLALWFVPLPHFDPGDGRLKPNGSHAKHHKTSTLSATIQADWATEFSIISDKSAKPEESGVFNELGCTLPSINLGDVKKAGTFPLVIGLSSFVENKLFSLL
ncbi:hypothetical protein V6N12_021846 [Hibiscus sabdariffa]|uniref:Uncharacterized protein n=1 Tax=Hibiscus sabdariffa TaxID=183260 RepID=A0ABR2FSW8_9ROSI